MRESGLRFSIRIPIVLLAAGALAWLAVVQGLGATTRTSQPQYALSQLPWDARIQASAAEELLTRNPRQAAARAQARALASTALARDPTLANAARLLGLLDSIEGQQARSLVFFRLSERLSRRDLPTQLFFIEERVAANDIRGALAHYDIALRTSSEAPDILYPVLVSATGERAVVQPLAEILARDPPWRRGFVERLVGAAPNADNAVLLLASIRAGRAGYERTLMRDLLARLVDARHFPAAERLYREVVDPARARAETALLLRNGGFGRDNDAPPFDWLLSREPALSAEQEIVPGGDGPVLGLRAAGANGGRAAQQVMMLARGEYEISFRAGALPDAAPAQLTFNIICASATQPTILALRPAQREGPQTGLFRVPDACPAQWLQVGVADGTDDQPRGGWIDNVQIRRRGG